MMQIYAMFKREASPEKVLEVARREAKDRRSDSPLFYAHLYVGLYYEAAGKTELVQKHMELAVKHRIDHYMWDVARVHLARLRKKPANKRKAESTSLTLPKKTSNE